MNNFFLYLSIDVIRDGEFFRSTGKYQGEHFHGRSCGLLGGNMEDLQWSVPKYGSTGHGLSFFTAECYRQGHGILGAQYSGY